METPRTRPALLDMTSSAETRGRASPLPSRASHFLKKLAAVRLPLPIARKQAKSMSSPNGPYLSMSAHKTSAAEPHVGAKPYMSQPMLSLPGHGGSDEHIGDAHSMMSSADENSPGTSQGKTSMDVERDSGRGHAQVRTKSTPGQLRSAANGSMHKKSQSTPLFPSGASPKIVVTAAHASIQVPEEPRSETTLANVRGRNSTLSDEGNTDFSVDSHNASSEQRRRNNAPGRPSSPAGGRSNQRSSSSLDAGKSSSVAAQIESSVTETSHATADTVNGFSISPLDDSPPTPPPKDETRTSEASSSMQNTSAPQSSTTPRTAHSTLPPSSFRANVPRLTSLPGFQTMPRPSSSGSTRGSGVPGTPSSSHGLPPSFASVPGTPSARLSPAVITRQPPYPILTLPPISPPQRQRSNTATGTSGSPDELAGTGRGRGTRMRSGSLLSMPALPMEGPDDSRRDDHDDDSSLEDLEEEDMMEDDDMDDVEDEHDRGMPSMESGRSSAFGLSDVDHDIDDDADDSSEQPSLEIQVERRAECDRPWQIPIPSFAGGMESSPLDTSFLDKYIRRQGDVGAGEGRPKGEDRTPVAFRGEDYFSSKGHFYDGMPITHPTSLPKDQAHPSRPNTSSSRPTSRQSKMSQEFGVRTVPMPSLGTPGLTARPSLYHHVSRSMVDMSTMVKDKEKSPEAPGREPVGLGVTVGPTPADEQTASERVQDGLLGASLRRQRSMPTFGPTTDPPPYPAFPSRPKISVQPRDEEGREPLPPYSNYIYLRSIMPRKMEFSAPGVQARDRKWRRTLCVLEGTAFKVYKCPKGAAGVGVLGEWWERRVGVGDIAEEPRTATVRTARTRAERDRERSDRELLREIREHEREAARSAKEGEGAAEAGASLSLPSTSSANAPQPQPVPIPSPAPPPPSATKSKLLPSLLHPLRNSPANSNSSDTGSPTRSRSGGDTLDENQSQGNTASSGRRSFSSLRPSLGGSSSSPSNLASSSASVNASRSMTQPSSVTSTSATRNRRTHAPSSSAPNTATYNVPINPLRIPSRPSMSSRSSARRGVRERSENSNPLWHEDPDAPPPSPSDLVKAYSLNHAESGLGSDYHKRRNVIRVRVDGEQFLLQAADVAGVVKWIEGFQAAANIALDLDERPMPKGPMFPRRRRRRARRPDGQTSAAGSGTVAQTGTASLRRGTGHNTTGAS